MKVNFLIFVLLFSVISCGKLEPNKVLRTSVEVFNGEKKENKGIIVPKVEEPVNPTLDINLSQLPDQNLADGTNTNLNDLDRSGTQGDSQSDDSEDLELSRDIETEIPEPDVTETEIPEPDVTVTEIPEPDVTETTDNNSPSVPAPGGITTDPGGTNLGEDYFGESFDVSALPDVTGEYNVALENIGEFFRYNGQICTWITVMTNLGPMSRIICISDNEYIVTEEEVQAPCIYENQIFSSSQEWEITVVVNPELNINDFFQVNRTYSEVTLRCNNGEILILPSTNIIRR